MIILAGASMILQALIEPVLHNSETIVAFSIAIKGPIFETLL